MFILKLLDLLLDILDIRVDLGFISLSFGFIVGQIPGSSFEFRIIIVVGRGGRNFLNLSVGRFGHLLNLLLGGGISCGLLFGLLILLLLSITDSLVTAADFLDLRGS